MNTFAPEFRALMIILRSTGPVISTRRSSRSSGIGATRQSPARMSAVSARKSGVSPASKRCLPDVTCGEEFETPRVEAAVQLGQETQRLRGQDFRGAAGNRARE